jgi:pimeloyl-ACP methyl ester carboxylesterase
MMPGFRSAGRRAAAGRATVALGAIALGLGGLALWQAARARRAERAHPPEGRFVTVDGVRLHYVEKGRGPGVLLLHGNGATVADLRISGLIDRLAERHRVVAIERPGFGYSERPRDRLWTPQAQARLLRRAAERLGLERPVVVGHSFGTLVALALALDAPGWVRGLVLLGGYYVPAPRLDVPLFAPPAVPVLGDVLRYTVSPLLGRLLAPRLIRRMFEPRPVTARFRIEFPLDLALRPSQLRASAGDAALMVPAAAALQARYGEIRIPTAILAGQGDRIVDPLQQSAALHRAIPGSTFRLIPTLGHMLHHFVPQQVRDAVRDVEAAAGGAGAA